MDNNVTLKTLRSIAREKKVRNYYKLNKEQLQRVLCVTPSFSRSNSSNDVGETCVSIDAGLPLQCVRVPNMTVDAEGHNSLVLPPVDSLSSDVHDAILYGNAFSINASIFFVVLHHENLVNKFAIRVFTDTSWNVMIIFTLIVVHEYCSTAVIKMQPIVSRRLISLQNNEMIERESIHYDHDYTIYPALKTLIKQHATPVKSLMYKHNQPASTFSWNEQTQCILKYSSPFSSNMTVSRYCVFHGRYYVLHACSAADGAPTVRFYLCATAPSTHCGVYINDREAEDVEKQHRWVPMLIDLDELKAISQYGVGIKFDASANHFIFAWGDRDIALTLCT